MVSVFG